MAPSSCLLLLPLLSSIRNFQQSDPPFSRLSAWEMLERVFASLFSVQCAHSLIFKWVEGGFDLPLMIRAGRILTDHSREEHMF